MLGISYVRVLLTLVVWLVIGCNSPDSQTQPIENDATQSTMDAMETPAAPAPTFDKSIRGLRLTRSIVVRAAPALEAEKLGTVAAHTIVGWKNAVKAAGCDQRWIEIEPRGWVCEGYLEPVTKEPEGVELPKLRIAERVPGTYGKASSGTILTIRDDVVIDETPIRGSATVRRYGTRMVDGVVHWKIEENKYVSQAALKLHEPSLFRGVTLDTSYKKSAFAVAKSRPGDWVVVRDGPGGTRQRRVSARSIVHMQRSQKDVDGNTIGYWIGKREYIDAADLRVIELQAPPPLTKEHERWVDVNLDTQVLVAYEGALPIYATLISSGTKKNATETGVFRIWIKFSETSMSGRMGESDEYSVATVPWTQFYEKDFALHTSYWHDGFGQSRSHGCINLSPRDARFLYFWSDPQVPKGWSMANASADLPGSMVRVRSAADPTPEFKGRALKVQQKRESESERER